MRMYALYVVTALLNCWLILFLLGISAGFASYLPIAALAGGLILFLVAAPTILFRIKSGLYFGLIGSLLLFPYGIYVIKGVWDDGIFKAGAFVPLIPAVFTAASLLLTVKRLYGKDKVLNKPILHTSLRLLFGMLPVFLLILYLVLIFFR